MREVVNLMSLEFTKNSYNFWFATREIAIEFSLLTLFENALDSRLNALGTPLADRGDGEPNEARVLRGWKRKLNSSNADEHDPFN